MNADKRQDAWVEALHRLADETRQAEAPRSLEAALLKEVRRQRPGPQMWQKWWQWATVAAVAAALAGFGFWLQGRSRSTTIAHHSTPAEEFPTSSSAVETLPPVSAPLVPGTEETASARPPERHPDRAAIAARRAPERWSDSPSRPEPKPPVPEAKDLPAAFGVPQSAVAASMSKPLNPKIGARPGSKEAARGITPWYFNQGLPAPVKAQVVEIEVSPSVAARLGVASRTAVKAELLIGDDGLTRAIRLVE